MILLADTTISPESTCSRISFDLLLMEKSRPIACKPASPKEKNTRTFQSNYFLVTGKKILSNNTKLR